jgi:hypothetical protein
MKEGHSDGVSDTNGTLFFQVIAPLLDSLEPSGSNK